jgi:hypothetical protein
MTVDNRTSLSTEHEYRLSSDTLFKVVTLAACEALGKMKIKDGSILEAFCERSWISNFNEDRKTQISHTFC